MKQTLLFFSWLVVVTNSWGQTIDTIIHAPNYTSYYSCKLHNPLFVIYKLYKGGGSCSRVSDKFITDNVLNSATAADYAASGYDEGHLANSKDFAYDCKLQEATFRFYNCVPQTPALNRGIWKKWETTVRQESQRDTLTIICGSVFGDKTIGKDKVSVPSQCWKIVYSKGQLLHSLIFPNDNSQSVRTITVDSIRGYYPQIKLPF
jgi:DNA/RNA endonuclease G (NUC1)